MISAFRKNSSPNPITKCRPVFKACSDSDRLEHREQLPFLYSVQHRRSQLAVLQAGICLLPDALGYLLKFERTYHMDLLTQNSIKYREGFFFSGSTYPCKPWPLSRPKPAMVSVAVKSALSCCQPWTFGKPWDFCSVHCYNPF